MIGFTVRTVTPEEAGALRDIRLRALVDAPLAFASTADPATAGEDREADTRHVLVAESPGGWVGLVELVSPSATAGSPRIEGLWVDPSWRRQGIGTALVNGVCAHARAAGVPEVMLWVGVNNRAALRLYRRLGFVATGRRRPVPSDRASTEQAMARDLRNDAEGSRERGPSVR